MGSFPVALGNGDEVIAFDLGGTSFRSALVTHDGHLTAVQRTSSINNQLLPGKRAADLVEEIAAYIVSSARSIRESRGLARKHPAIAVSMGAALNAHTGEILGSGPIFGEGSTPIHLEALVRKHLPDVRVTVVNDVTASLIAHSQLPELRRTRRLALITVSTGIASRVLHCSVPHVPVDPSLGTQGEIGHHPIQFSVDGVPLSLKCDCGGVNHLNAFSSGRGIKRVLNGLRELVPHDFQESSLNHRDPQSDVPLDAFVTGLIHGDPLCHKVLRAVTAPVAEAVKWHFVLDPEIDKLVLTGGVCFSLQSLYLSAILENLGRFEFYPLESDHETFWRERVILGPVSDDAGLIGAAYLARETPNIHRRENLTLEPPYRVSRQHVTDYPVHLVKNVLADDTFPEDLLEPFDRIILVADTTVQDIYGDSIQKMLAGRHRRRQVETVLFRAAEKQKDLFAVTEMISAFEGLGVRRRKDLVVAAGGGITLDVAAFSCNLFRRGVACLRFPTTLVGQIDAGIGVKNAINFRNSKSRLGTFAPPYAVVVDPCFLATLSDRQIRNGLSESLKIALVVDPALFGLIEKHAHYLVCSKLQCEEGQELIRRSIRAMLLELSANLYERTLDRFPDYGHTFSPTFEFELSDLEHGEAVALDMAITTALTVEMGILDIEIAERILRTQQALGLPIHRPGVNMDMLFRGIRDAEKHRGGRLRMPVLQGIGEATFIDEVSEAHLKEALAFVRSWSRGRLSNVSKSA